MIPAMSSMLRHVAARTGHRRSRQAGRGFTLVELPVVRQRKRDAFTLIELLVVVAIISLLISILLPSLSRARDQAHAVQCLANHRSLCLSTLLYAEEWGGWLPHCTKDDANPLRRHQRWMDYIDRTGGEDLRRCTGRTSLTFVTDGGGYWTGEFTTVNETDRWSTVNCRFSTRDDKWQTNPHNTIRKIKQVALVMITIDNGDARYAGGWVPGWWLRWRHRGGEAINLSFLDGHAETWDRTSVVEAYGDPDDPRNLIVRGLHRYPWYEPE